MTSDLVKGIVVVFVFLGLGAGCLLLGSGMSREKEAVARWSPAEGVIRSSGAVPKTGGRRGLTSGWGPSVSYVYVARGVEHTGSGFTAGGRYWSANRDEVDVWLGPYRPGAAVTVYYDPENPSESVLDRNDYGHADSGAKAVGWFFIGLGALGFGALVVRAWRGEFG